MLKNFDEYAYYYNAFYGEKDYKAEAQIISSLIDRYWDSNSKPKKILNLGCGTGKHDVELSKLGYQIKGIDISENMISTARSTSQSDLIIYEVGDVRDFRDNIKYDVCTSLFHVMSYQNSNDDLRASILTASQELRTKGLFIFDCWYGPGVLTERPEVRIKRIDDERSILIRHAIPVMHPAKNIVDVNYEILIIDKETKVVSAINEVHSMRYLFTPEIELMLQEFGFELLDCLDCNSLEKVTYDSWTAFFIAKKQ